MNGLLNITHFPDAGAQHIGLAQQPPNRRPELPAQLFQVSANHVPQFHPFQVAPHPLVRVQLRGVAGQLLQPDAPGRALTQPLLHRPAAHRPAAMDGCPVPNHQQLARYLFQQLFQKPDYVRPFVGVVLGCQVKLSGHADSADGAQALTAQLVPDYRGPAHRRPGAMQGGKQVKPRFVGPQDGPAFGYGLFLSSAKRRSRQSLMASSFRWEARSAGFCRLKPHSLRIRPTWEGS